MANLLCRSISVWGEGDADSWIRWARGDTDEPLLFDTQYQPKPAYWAVVSALAGK
jgi:endo-1,4-beta-xylanase